MNSLTLYRFSRNSRQLEVLLVQAGYLSIQSATASDFIVDYPNREVALSMARLYAQELLGGRHIEKHGGLEIAEVLERASVKDVVEALNLVFDAMDCKDYPIRDEASCRSHLQVLLLGAAMLTSVETHDAKGRSDLSVMVSRRHWIFEIKFARRGDDPTKLLDMACRQMQDRRYDEVISGKEWRLSSATRRAGSWRGKAFEWTKGPAGVHIRRAFLQRLRSDWTQTPPSTKRDPKPEPVVLPSVSA